MKVDLPNIMVKLVIFVILRFFIFKFGTVFGTILISSLSSSTFQPIYFFIKLLFYYYIIYKYKFT